VPTGVLEVIWHGGLWRENAPSPLPRDRVRGSVIARVYVALPSNRQEAAACGVHRPSAINASPWRSMVSVSAGRLARPRNAGQAPASRILAGRVLRGLSSVPVRWYPPTAREPIQDDPAHTSVVRQVYARFQQRRMRLFIWALSSNSIDLRKGTVWFQDWTAGLRQYSDRRASCVANNYVAAERGVRPFADVDDSIAQEEGFGIAYGEVAWAK
jgi:hypothetical protein